MLFSSTLRPYHIIFGSESRICRVFCFSVHNTWATLLIVSQPKKTLSVPRDTTHDQTPLCARPYALVHGQADCALWDLAHRSRFIRAVFFPWEYSHPRRHFYHPWFSCSSRYRLSLQYTHSRTVCSPSHLKLALLTNGVYDLHDRTIFVHLCVCVWCGTLTDTWQFTSSQVQFLLPKD